MGLNFLEKEMFESFINRLEDDASLPASLVGSIKNLHLIDKLATGDALKKILEEFTPKEISPNEDKSN